MEPRPLFENATPPASTDGRGREPRPLSFDKIPPMKPTVQPTPAQHSDGPRPLSFADVPVVAQTTKTSQNSIPRPLDLTQAVVPRKAPPKQAGQALFAEATHAAQAAAENAAKRIDAPFFEQQQDRVHRMIAALLPLNAERVESCGLSVLERQRETTIALTELTRRITLLDAGKVLEEAAQACTPKTGLFDKLKAKFRPFTDYEAQLKRIALELRAILPEIRQLRPKALDNESRFSAQVLSLRAVAMAAGEGDPTLMRLLEQRMETLRAGLTQAKLVPLHLQQMEQTVQTYHEQCEQLLQVTLTAAALVQSSPRP